MSKLWGAVHMPGAVKILNFEIAPYVYRHGAFLVLYPRKSAFQSTMRPVLGSISNSYFMPSWKSSPS